MKRKPWQRTALSVLGVLIIALMWRWAVGHLYVLPQAAIAAFVTITTNAFYTISAIVVFMVTGKLIYDWKNASETTVHIADSIEKQLRPKDLDDPSIP